jgi:nitrilase
MSTKVAVVQSPPVLLHREATIAKVLASIDEAAKAGASLMVFPEAYVPGYPTWIWRLRPGGDMGLSSEIHARLRENAVDLARGDLQPVQEAAANCGATIVLGINELDSEFSGTTLFNTVVVIGSDGTLLNRHRKLMPTNPERMIWGMGDASGLRVVDTPAGRIGSLICWESYMPLARYALYAQNIEIYGSHMGHRRELDCHHAPHRQGIRLLGDWHRNRNTRQRHTGRLSRARQALQVGRMDQ